MPASRGSPASSASTTPCCPHLERALLAGHDLVLLGERGQGKTRLIRTLAGLLDEWTPVVDGLRDQRPPVRARSACAPPAGRRARRRPPVAWRHRDDRYGEKLATPDTSVGDLIGDVDPIKVAEGRTLGDPETVHYGLVPRTNRGIFAVNELPDLAERIQVSLLNVLEERDIQVRGYRLRLPLDLLLVASANPEDYTNRGRIITPLKDRFGAEIRTHYPLRLADELALVRQEAELASAPTCPSTSSRSSPGSPGGARVAGRRRPVRRLGPVRRRRRRDRRRLGATPRGHHRRDAAVARVCDLPAVVATLRGKVEFEVSEEGREKEVLEHLLRRAVAETFRRTARRRRPAGAAGRFDEGGTVESGELVPAAELLRRIGPVAGLAGSWRGSAWARRVARRRRGRAGVRPGGALPDAPARPRTTVGRPTTVYRLTA